MQTYREIVNEQDSIWIGYDQRYHDYLVEAFRKVDGGVKHLVNRYKQARLEMIYHDLEHHGFFSKRPFQLGQGCDGSGDACCHALFYHFCQSRGLEAAALHRQAYAEQDGSKYHEQDYEAIKELADWQEVAYPTRWTEQAYQGLIKSLLDINNRSLVVVLEETVEALTKPNELTLIK
jgi:hypothetical protein